MNSSDDSFAAWALILMAIASMTSCEAQQKSADNLEKIADAMGGNQ